MCANCKIQAREICNLNKQNNGARKRMEDGGSVRWIGETTKIYRLHNQSFTKMENKSKRA